MAIGLQRKTSLNQARCAIKREPLSLRYMTITMNDSRIVSIVQIKEFLKVDSAIKFKAVSRAEKYEWTNNTLTKFRYFSLKKKDKGIVRSYIARMIGLSPGQVTEMIKRKKKTGRVFYNSTARHCFPRKYNPLDIALLVKTDNFHERLSAPATKGILQREYNVFNKEEYQNISKVSVSHIYNLRETRQYRSHSLTIKKTNSRQIPIGERRRPEPEGRPGFLRVDTVHQGDYEKKKGVYHINIVDEVLQWEIVGCVEKISEYYLKPLLEALLEQLPFKALNFHSDNGSEYINKIVAKLLNKLLVSQTKSRARHCNDNALAEGKNGAVVRKYMGYVHIPCGFAGSVNQFYKEHLNAYLNYHRPCGFPTIVENKKGKLKKVYRGEDYQVPYEKLKSLKNGEQYLKEGVSFEMLDKIAYCKSDNEFAEEMQKAKEKLFKNFKHIPQEMLSFATFVSRTYTD